MFVGVRVARNVPGVVGVCSSVDFSRESLQLEQCSEVIQLSAFGKTGCTIIIRRNSQHIRPHPAESRKRVGGRCLPRYIHGKK